MELFGIGIFEIILIMLIALIFLGPQDTIKAGRNLGRAVRRFFSSEEWRTLLQASREIRTIPEKFLEETGLDHPENILPSEAEFRQEAGLNELEQDMAELNADVSTMKKAATEDQPGQILPPENVIRPPASSPGTVTRQARLDELERDLSEWKADLSAWGNSPVIIPTPQTSVAAQIPTESGQAPASTGSEQAPASTGSGQEPASTVSGQAPASAEPASPAQDQPESEPPAQTVSGQEPASTVSEQAPASAETASSPSPDQEQQ
jgi:Sec-independent protein translocase protein TatA